MRRRGKLCGNKELAMQARDLSSQTRSDATIPRRSRVRQTFAESWPASTQPPVLGVGTLDNVRAVLWQAYRHLFPPHALAAQTGNGNMVISWSVMDDPLAPHPYAAPVMLRIAPELLQALWRVEPRARMRIAQNHEPTLREGLRGYDPFSRFPNARVISIG
jgi:hypothetical protein